MFSLAMAMVDAHSLSNIICRSGEWQVTVGRKSVCVCVCVCGGGGRERERERVREREIERGSLIEKGRESMVVSQAICVLIYKPLIPHFVSNLFIVLSNLLTSFRLYSITVAAPVKAFL